MEGPCRKQFFSVVFAGRGSLSSRTPWPQKGLLQVWRGPGMKVGVDWSTLYHPTNNLRGFVVLGGLKLGGGGVGTGP